MTKLFLIALIAAALVLCGGCKRAAEPGHTGESAEEHAGHAHEDEAAEGQEHHEDETAEEHAAHAGETEHADEATGGLIVFSKKMQQDFGIQTQPAALRPVHPTIRARGEIKPAGSREAEVFAPFAGMLIPDAERGLLVRPGEQVRKGDHLAMLAPSTDETGWFSLLSAYRLAQSEYNRSRELQQSGAAAPRRVQEAELDLQLKEARLRAALGGADPQSLDTTDMLFHLRAPASGILTDVHLRFGQRVEMGEHLFNIVDPTRVWLECHVPAAEAARLTAIQDAYFTLGGTETTYRTADLGGKLISVGGMLNPETRRVEVIFEIDNPHNVFKPGSYAQVFLRERASRESLAIPQSAVLDEDGIPVAMLQVAEEDFRKVVLKTGARDEDFVEVLSGLHAGDRVVVEGAYKVKLGSNQQPADAHAGHGH